uniref:Uncharacterized protein n=1 Tax=Prymnesium polylepis TaxID=72548 RepID=A0A6T8BW13_9EUKA|mmetsp:Transcript_39412/g.98288  ORF Transcript_39412/g.98288 Transcript_39412/m.98288 type:complete len:319 (+) Transcript_39412:11-967(+)
MVVGEEPPDSKLVFIARVSESTRSLKLTVKPAALGKAFTTTIVEPFLKWHNATLSESEHLHAGGLETVTIGAADSKDKTTEVVSDLSASCSSVMPAFAKGVANIELVPRKERELRFVLLGIQLDMTVRRAYVDAPLSLVVFPEFLRTVNAQYNVAPEIAYNDVAQVRLRDASLGLEERQIDLSAPAFKVLARDARTDIDVILKPSVATRVIQIPKGVDEEPPKHNQMGIFHVQSGEVKLKLTLPQKALSKSLRQGVIVPFLAAYAKKTGTPLVSADEVLRLEVDGLPMSDAISAASVWLGSVVRVDITLPPVKDGTPP